MLPQATAYRPAVLFFLSKSNPLRWALIWFFSFSRTSYRSRRLFLHLRSCTLQFRFTPSLHLEKPPYSFLFMFTGRIQFVAPTLLYGRTIRRSLNRSLLSVLSCPLAKGSKVVYITLFPVFPNRSYRHLLKKSFHIWAKRGKNCTQTCNIHKTFTQLFNFCIPGYKSS